MLDFYINGKYNNLNQREKREREKKVGFKIYKEG